MSDKNVVQRDYAIYQGQVHTGRCIRRFAGIYAYCRYFIDRKWSILVLILCRKTCHILKDYRIRSFLSIWHAPGDLCKHLGKDLSTDTRIYS